MVAYVLKKSDAILRDHPVQRKEAPTLTAEDGKPSRKSLPNPYF